jgi:hypothetical protein
MPLIDSSRGSLIDQFDAAVQDRQDKRPTSGSVYFIGNGVITVQVAGTGTLLPGVYVSGGTNGLVVGDTVYLLYFGNTPVAISTRSFTSGLSTPGTANHNHDNLYYEKPIIDQKLSLKSNVGHTHNPGIISATSGTIGLWTIDQTGIYETHTRLDGTGYLSFGNNPAHNWGGIGWTSGLGVWLGWDYGHTDINDLATVFQNDPEGNATAAGPKLALYQDANNYLVWTGSKLLIKAANFKLDGSGNLTASNATLSGTITASAGSIGNWLISGSQLQSKTGTIILDAANEVITLGSGITLDGLTQQILVGQDVPRLVIDGAAKTISSSNFVTGLRGFQLNGNTGGAEFDSITVRGELRASVFTIGEVHAIGGSFIALAAAPLYADAFIP